MGKESRILSTVVKVWLGLVLFGFTAVLAGCGGSTTAVSDLDRVIGIAGTSAPIANSSVSFYEGAEERDPQIEGVPVATATTNEHGLFLSSAFSAKNGNFRVTVKGGTLDGKPIIGTLRAHVRNYKFGETVHVNGVTTLVSAYFDATPGITLEEAETAVGNFLQLSGTKLGSAYAPYDSKAFSHVVFHEEASAHAHMNAFIDSLVAEMKADTSATHHFKGTKSNSAGSANGINSRAALNRVIRGITGNPLADWVLTQIASGALGHAGGWAAGKLFTALGIEDSTPDMKNAISQIQSALYDLKNQISSVNQNVLEGTYQNIVSANQELLNGIDTNIGNIATLSTITPADYAASKQYYDNLSIQYKNSLRALTTGSANTQLHNVMVGATAPGSQALIKLFSRIVVGAKPFFNKQDSEDYFTVMHYWQNKQIALFGLIVAQLQVDGAPQTGPASLTEAANLFRGDVPKEQPPAADSQLGIQNAMLPNSLPTKDTIIDVKHNLMVIVSRMDLFTFVINYFYADNCAAATPPQVDQYFHSLPLSGWRISTNDDLGKMIGTQSFDALGWPDGWYKGGISDVFVEYRRVNVGHWYAPEYACVPFVYSRQDTITFADLDPYGNSARIHVLPVRDVDGNERYFYK